MEVRHEERRGHPLARHVPQRHREHRRASVDEIEVVAPDVRGGDVSPRHAVRRAEERIRRKERLLEIRGAFQLRFHLAGPLQLLEGLRLEDLHGGEVADVGEDQEVGVLVGNGRGHVVHVEDAEHLILVPEGDAHRGMDPLADHPLLRLEPLVALRVAGQDRGPILDRAPGDAPAHDDLLAHGRAALLGRLGDQILSVAAQDQHRPIGAQGVRGQIHDELEELGHRLVREKRGTEALHALEELGHALR